MAAWVHSMFVRTYIVGLCIPV